MRSGWLSLLCVLAACGSKSGAADSSVRGKGLKTAQLESASQAQVYRLAIRSALPEDAIALVHPEYLPDDAGYGPAKPLAPYVIDALKSSGAVKGTCDAAPEGKYGPYCDEALPGYIVRFSRLFVVGGDTVQVYLAGDRFDTKSSGRNPLFRFERAFQMVPSEGAWHWRVVREAHVRKADRT